MSVSPVLAYLLGYTQLFSDRFKIGLAVATLATTTRRLDGLLLLTLLALFTVTAFDVVEILVL